MVTVRSVAPCPPHAGTLHHTCLCLPYGVRYRVPEVLGVVVQIAGSSPCTPYSHRQDLALMNPPPRRGFDLFLAEWCWFFSGHGRLVFDVIPMAHWSGILIGSYHGYNGCHVRSSSNI